MIHGLAPRRRLAAHLAAPLAGALVALLPLGLPAPAAAQDATVPPPVAEGWRPRPVRSGTVALHGAGMYGTLLGGPLADTFDHGLGLGFALRYRTSADASLGFGFESHQFDGKSDADSAATPVLLKMVMTTIDYYRHFSVRTRTPRYLVIGAGLMQSRQENLNEETEFRATAGCSSSGAASNTGRTAR